MSIFQDFRQRKLLVKINIPEFHEYTMGDKLCWQNCGFFIVLRNCTPNVAMAILFFHKSYEIKNWHFKILGIIKE